MSPDERPPEQRELTTSAAIGSTAETSPIAATTAEASATTTADPDVGRPGVPAVAGGRDDLTANTLLALLRATFADGHAHHWGACLDTLGPISAGLPSDLAGWSEGRAWDARAEVRWQPASAERYAALYLGDGETLPEGFQALDGDLRAVPGAETDGLFLWGTRGADSQYWDPRLPRPLDYAGLGATAPEARVPCRLLVDADGQVRFIRLTTAVEAG